MSPARPRQLVFSAAMRVPRRTAAGSLSFEALMRIARRGAGTALVEYDLAGQRLLIPVGHEISRYRRYWPGYGESLTRVARGVHEKRPGMTAVDVGANVGDSTVLLRRGAPVPVLCVEGDPGFAAILRRNVADLPGVEVEEAFVGPSGGERRVNRRSEGGTLWLEPDPEGSEVVRFRTLAELLADHPALARPALVKIDTDGFDCDIVAAERETLSALRPALFFEYAPDMYRDPAGAFAVFETLEGIGYDGLLAYLNHGEFLVAARLGEQRLLEDLHGFVTGHAPYGEPSLRYLDLCAFHRDDTDLWDTIRRRELGSDRAGPASIVGR